MSNQPKGTFARIVVGVSWLLADRGMRLAGGFVVGLWLARYLGPADFGLLSVATAATFFGVVATQMGLDGIVQRELVHRPDDAGRIIGTVTALSLVTAMVTWSVIALLALFVVGNPTMRLILLWLGVLVVPQALAGWEYLFHSRSDFRPLVIGQNGCFVVCLALRGWLITQHAPVVAFAIIAVAERLVSVGTVIAWASRRHPVGRLHFDRSLARRILAEAWPVWTSALLTTLYLKMDQVLVLHWAGEVATGTYAAAMKLSELWWSISMVIATAILPDLVRACKKSEAEYHRVVQRYLDASVVISTMAALIMTFLAPILVRLFYGLRYEGAASILIIQFWSAVFIFLTVARGRHLIARGRRLVELWFALGGVAISLCANFLLTPRFGTSGAAWAGLITQAGVALALPWLFADTRAITRMQVAALLFPFRIPALWTELRLQLKPKSAPDFPVVTENAVQPLGKN